MLLSLYFKASEADILFLSMVSWSIKAILKEIARDKGNRLAPHWYLKLFNVRFLHRESRIANWSTKSTDHFYPLIFDITITLDILLGIWPTLEWSFTFAHTIYLEKNVILPCDLTHLPNTIFHTRGLTKTLRKAFPREYAITINIHSPLQQENKISSLLNQMTSHFQAYLTKKNKLEVVTQTATRPPFSKIIRICTLALLWRHDGQTPRIGRADEFITPILVPRAAFLCPFPFLSFRGAGQKERGSGDENASLPPVSLAKNVCASAAKILTWRDFVNLIGYCLKSAHKQGR